MSCLAPERIAELALGSDGDDPHVADCLACRSALADQRAIRELAQRMPVAGLSRTRREAIAAEVIAQSDLTGAPSSGARQRTLAAVLAVAAAAGIALASWPRVLAVPGRIALASSEPVALGVRGTAAEDPAPPAAPLAAVEGIAELTRAASGGRDVIALRGGSVTLDARETRDVDVTASDTVVHVDHAKARVVARAGVIESVAVFAGSVEVTAHGKRQVIEAGETWVAPHLAPPDPARAPAVQPFLDGWTALRAGDNQAAIAAFDRATDPAVVEDAVYWAAVAAERAGDHAEATRRFADFLARFASSPHTESARAALARHP